MEMLFINKEPVPSAVAVLNMPVKCNWLLADKRLNSNKNTF
jgi:hypothetical protein